MASRAKWKVTMDLKNQVANVRRGVTDGMKKAAKILEAEIKSRARVGKKSFVDKWGAHPGAMKRTTAVKAIGGKRPRMEVTSTNYALYMDQGTSTIEPDYFITGTIKQYRRSIIKSIAAEARKQSAKRAAKGRGRRKR